MITANHGFITNEGVMPKKMKLGNLENILLNNWGVVH